MDAPTIDVCLSVFPWAKFRAQKGAVKLNGGLGHDGVIPAFSDLTDGKTHEVNIGRTIKLPKGRILTMDRGYIDFQWFDDLNRPGVFFVTRAKINMCYRVVLRHQSNRKQGITRNQTIELSSQEGKQYTSALRREAYKDPGTKKHYYYLTNQMNLAANTRRWQPIF
jgi:putative transposase